MSLLKTTTVIPSERLFWHEQCEVIQLLGHVQDEPHVRATSTLVRFFETPTSKEFVLLFDCGSLDESDFLNTKLAQYNVASIDVVVFSHGHIDHIGGAPALKPSPKRLFTSKSISADCDFHYISDKIIAFKTPGHTHDDISVLINVGEGVVLAGDIFESADDSNYDGKKWKDVSAHPTLQHRSREFLIQYAKIVVPGHGPAFQFNVQEFKSVTIPMSIKNVYQSCDKTAWIFQDQNGFNTAVTTSSMDVTTLFDTTPTVNCIVHIGLDVVTQLPSTPVERLYLDDDVYIRSKNSNRYESVADKNYFYVTDSLVVYRIPVFGGKMLRIVVVRKNSGLFYVPLNFSGANNDDNLKLLNLLIERRFMLKPIVSSN